MPYNRLKVIRIKLVSAQRSRNKEDELGIRFPVCEGLGMKLINATLKGEFHTFRVEG